MIRAYQVARQQASTIPAHHGSGVLQLVHCYSAFESPMFKFGLIVKSIGAVCERCYFDETGHVRFVT